MEQFYCFYVSCYLNKILGFIGGVGINFKSLKEPKIHIK